MGITGLRTFTIFLGVIAAVAGLAYYLNSKRRRDLAELASSRGLLLSGAGPEAGLLEATGLELFRQGHSRKAANLIQFPVRGGEIRIFDYKYVSGRGRNSHSYDFTVALIKCGCEVPDFDLKPEGLIYKIGEMAGFKDIDLPAFPVFSDKYRLTGPDKTAVHMFFSPKRAAWFEHHQGLRAQGAPGSLLLFRDGGRLPVSAWQGFLEEAKIFATEIIE